MSYCKKCGEDADNQMENPNPPKKITIENEIASLLNSSLRSLPGMAEVCNTLLWAHDVLQARSRTIDKLCRERDGHRPENVRLKADLAACLRMLRNTPYFAPLVCTTQEDVATVRAAMSKLQGTL